MTAEPGKLVESLSDAMDRLYKTGGLMLVFLLVGTVTLLVGVFQSGVTAEIMVGAGTLMLLGCWVLFARAQFQAAKSSAPFREFCARIEGSWWEWITPGDAVALSFFTLKADPLTGTVRMSG